jgi:hypothetical protein
VIDLNVWHHAIHQVTGDMAMRFNRATPADLQRWARALHKVAAEMELNGVSLSAPNTHLG